MVSVHPYLKLNSLDDRKESFEELDEDLITVFQFKTDVVGLHPCQVLCKSKFKSFSYDNQTTC